MEIDWLTTSAQIVNFLVLVLLLRKFLYRPILHNMQLREQGIAEKLAEADEMQRDAEHRAEQYRAKLQDFENQRAALLDEAKREVDEQRSRMIEELREEIDQKRVSWYADLAEEKNSSIADIKVLLGEKIMRLSRKALSDLAGANLEHQIIQRFVEQLRRLPEEEHQRLLDAVGRQGWVRILTHFEVDAGAMSPIRDCLLDLFPALRIEFVTTHEITCGVVLETEGYSWPWTFDRYLEELEEMFADLDVPTFAKDFA